MIRRYMVVLLVVAEFAIAETPPTAQWSFGPGAALPGDVVGGAEWSENPPAIVFNGEQPQQHILVADDLNRAGLPKKALSVAAWIRVDSHGEWGGIVSAIQDNGSYERGWLLGTHKDRFCIGLTSTSKKRLTYLSADRPIDLGHWQFVAASYDGSELRIYVDGKPAGSSKAQSGDILYPPKGILALGAYVDDNEQHPVPSALANIAIWDRALPPNEIAALFARDHKRFPKIDPPTDTVTGWPTYRRDIARSGHSPEALSLPMNRLWQVANPAPVPAWPPPAKQDFWNKKPRLPPRVTYDRVDHVVAAQGRVLQGSSASDALRCRDLATGDEQWRFVTQGPVRVAPCIAGERVVLGSDDGYIYCLNLADGALLWRQAAAPETLRIPGNGRIISAWPVRGSPLVHERLVHACAGIFPEQGVYRISLDLETGEPVQRQPLRASAQGYLARNGSRLVVPTGRDPAGTTITALRGRSTPVAQAKTPAPYDLATISAGELRIGGGNGIVGILDSDDRVVWKASVIGRALGLAVCDDRLLVSTDSGQLYAFGQGPDIGIAPAPVVRPVVTRGYQLHIGPNPPSSEYRIIHSIADSATLRQAASTKPGYGEQLVVHELANPLPYGDYLFNHIVANGDQVSEAELMRVLRPGGTAVINGKARKRLAPEGAGEWTHLYGNAANTACSGDSLVGGKMALQWFGEPGPEKMLDRHHRTVAPLSKSGRLIVPGNNRVFGVDAYNGSVWWEREIPNSRRAAAFRDCGGMALTDDLLYVAAGSDCLLIHPETGVDVVSLSVPRKDRDWGYVAGVDGRLFGSSTQRSASRRGHSRATISEGTYFDFRPLVTSDSAFAYGPDHNLLWQYQPTGAIINPTFTVAGDLLCFAESATAETLEAKDGRVSPRDLFGGGSRLVALDVITGKPRWTRDLDAATIAHASYLLASAGKLVLTGSLNSPGDRKTARLLYKIWVFDQQDGSLLWETTQEQGTKIGGDHGEQDHHPVIVGDRLICEPHAYSLSSGSPLDNWGWSKRHRRGCGTISASLSTLFFRQANPSRFELADNHTAKVTAVTRPGCWINMIPAGGLLLIPEASSGCSCNFGVQSSLAFRPVP